MCDEVAYKTGTISHAVTKRERRDKKVLLPKWLVPCYFLSLGPASAYFWWILLRQNDVYGQKLSKLRCAIMELSFHAWISSIKQPMSDKKCMNMFRKWPLHFSFVWKRRMASADHRADLISVTHVFLTKKLIVYSITVMPGILGTDLIIVTSRLLGSRE